MKVACISLYQENYKPLADLTLAKNRREYCQRWNYLPVFDCCKDMPGATIPQIHKKLGFRKIELILEVFKEQPHIELAWFADCDGMVTNFNAGLAMGKRVEDPCILLSSDCHGINCGSMMVRNNAVAIGILRFVLSMKDDFANEQEVFKQIIKQYPNLIQVYKQRIMNSYDYNLYPDAKPVPGFEHLTTEGQWQKGDFFVHWPGRNLEQRIAHYHEYEKEIVQ